MYVFSLSTFLKICLLDHSKQIAEIQKKISPSGGYDYYRTLNLAIKAKSNGKTEDEINHILNSPSNAAERVQNTTAYEYFAKKYGVSKSLSTFYTSRSISNEYGYFKILINPSFSISTGGERKIFCIWPNQNPKMTRTGGAIACYLMKEAYKNSKLSNSEFFLLDVVGKRQYSEKAISNTTSIVFNSVVRTMSDMFADFQ